MGFLELVLMSLNNQSLFSTETLSLTDIESLFSLASKIKKTQVFPQVATNKMAGLLFLEPSTRTRISFEVAAKKIGLKTFLLQGDSSSSLSKGESLEDTVETLLAMKPDVLVARYKDLDLGQYLRSVSTPVLCGGEGQVIHPTQALLDAFTLREAVGDIKGKKLVIVGDVAHSRVAQSNFNLMAKLGVKVAVCSPGIMFPDNFEGLKKINSINTAIDWCDAIMVLRVQKERHINFGFDESEYVNKYCFRVDHLKKMRPNQFVMHPGPYVPGVDMESEVLLSEKSLIRKQVENGVYIRAALLLAVLGEECLT